MRDDADLSMRGLSRLVAEFLERLDLRAVTLVENDWGGAHLLVTEKGSERVARLVLTSCEAFDNYPPGLPGRAVWLAAKVPGGLNAMVQPRLAAISPVPSSAVRPRGAARAPSLRREDGGARTGEHAEHSSRAARGLAVRPQGRLIVPSRRTSSAPRFRYYLASV
jgi:pimeloyl-ACP methyl ester carboxylesterase